MLVPQIANNIKNNNWQLSNTVIPCTAGDWFQDLCKVSEVKVLVAQ